MLVFVPKTGRLGDCCAAAIISISFHLKIRVVAPMSGRTLPKPYPGQIQAAGGSENWSEGHSPYPKSVRNTTS